MKEAVKQRKSLRRERSVGGQHENEKSEVHRKFKAVSKEGGLAKCVYGW